MSTQNLRQAPELVDQRNLQSEQKEASPLIVEYPGSEKVVVTLSEQVLWDEIAAARSPAPPAEGESAAKRAAAEENASEVAPSSAAAFVVAGLGIALVAYLWSFIIL